MYNQLINEAEVQKTWGPIITEATGVEDREKLAWMSKYCHYHNLNESMWNTVHLNPNVNVPGMGAVTLPGDPTTLDAFHTQATGSGDRPFSLLPLAMQVAAQTVGLDLVPVVPMQGPMGVLTYLDFVYAGGRIQAGDEAAPLMIKINLNNTGEIDSFTAGDVIYCGTTIGVSQYNPAVPGTHFAYELTFIGRSRIDGLAIFRVRANTTNGQGHNYAQGSEDGGIPFPQAVAQGLPYFEQANIAAATQQGDFDGPPELVKALEDHITGFSGSDFESSGGGSPSTGGQGNLFPNIDGNDPYERGIGEQTPDNLIGLNLFNKSVAAQTFQVAAGVTREQVQDLKQFGIDAVAQVEAVLVNELTQSINKLILDRIFRNGATNTQNVQAVDGFNLCEAFTIGAGTGNFALGPNNVGVAVGGTLTKASVQVGTGGETQGTLQRRLLSKILAATNLISIRGRRGPATFAVVGGQIGTALQDIAGFVPYPLSNTVNQAGGSLYPIGAIAGVTVYVDPTMGWNDTRVAVGRKGDGNSPGLVFMPYLMAESVETIAEGTMAPKIAVKSRFALVDAGFHPETMYYTLQFLFGAGVEII